LAPAPAQNALKEYAAKTGDFTFKAPSAFKDIVPAPANAIVAVEVTNPEVSFLASKDSRSKEEDTDITTFADYMAESFTKSGAKVRAKAKGTLCGMPAVSFLIGGRKAGRESLMVFNLRKGYTYSFVLNYPEKQRKDGQELWEQIAPTIKFKQ
jgi:hypothetical protein